VSDLRDGFRTALPYSHLHLRRVLAALCCAVLFSAGSLWLWRYLCCAAITHTHHPRLAAPSVQGGVRVYLLCTSACVSLLWPLPPFICPQSHTLVFPRCSPPFVLRCVLRQLVAAATRPVCFLELIHTIHTPTPALSTTARTSCALLPYTAPPSPWPARYPTTSSNREAMSTNCAHVPPTVPC
jgi:hypothetical protein